MYKAILLALAAVGLAGCVTATNSLSKQDVATFRYAGTSVRFAPDVKIWWGDGERAYAASKGQPATESEILAKTPEGQAYLRDTITTKLKVAVERQVAAGMIGTRPVRIEIIVKDVTIASAIQRVLVGGHHTMTADVNLVDAKTGAIIAPYAAQSAMSFAGQGIGGALVDAALLAEPIDRVINNYAEQYAGWLLRT
ncbi:MAG: hypothetical protein WDO17_12585 [Alphaproteobacteria bacterium]